MTGNMQEKDSSFIVEKIKEHPVNKKKLVKKTMTTISMALIFGMVASITFLVLQPVINNLLYPEEKPEAIYFPEDREEMTPQEMMSDSIEKEEEPTDSFWENELKPKAYLEEAIENIADYRRDYISLKDYVNEIQKSMVEITAITSDTNWLIDEYENTSKTMGVIIDNSGKEIAILTDAATIAGADSVEVEFFNGRKITVSTIQMSESVDLALLRVASSLIEDILPEEEIFVSKLGSSSGSRLTGTPVVALGSPMGSIRSVGHGIITSQNGKINKSDMNYHLLTTDIFGSELAKGFLFDLQGQMIGIVNPSSNEEGITNLISAYGITEIKQIITKLSKGNGLPYLGLTLADVSGEASTMMNVPYGAYISDVDLDSPAMEAGIYRGDIIVKVNDRDIITSSDYVSAMTWLEPGQSISIEVKRLVQEEYKKMTIEIILGQMK